MSAQSRLHLSGSPVVAFLLQPPSINDTTLLVSPLVVVTNAYEMLFVTGELYPHLFASSWIFF